MPWIFTANQFHDGVRWLTGHEIVNHVNILEQRIAEMERELANEKATTEFFKTRPMPPATGEPTDDQIDAALSKWFSQYYDFGSQENFRLWMRAAIRAALQQQEGE